MERTQKFIITHEQENKIKDMIKSIQPSMEKYCKIYKEDGWALSYCYLSAKICEILEFRDLEKVFNDKFVSVGLTGEKLRLHDFIWRKICYDMDFNLKI